MIGRLAIIGLACATLGGCITDGTGSIKGGECRVFERPEYVVKGRRQYDQDWVDSQVEGGVGACGWKRPAVRPASIDAKPGAPIVRATAPKRRGLARRIKDRVWPTDAPAVIPTPVAPERWPSPQAAPLDPVDELLDGK